MSTTLTHNRWDRIYPNIQIKKKFSNLTNDGSKEPQKQQKQGTSSAKNCC